MKDAELSWLDARIARRKAITGATSAVKENREEGEEMPNEDETMEQGGEEETGDGERLSNKKAAAADTFCLEPMPSSNIPSHQVSCYDFLDSDQ